MAGPRSANIKIFLLLIAVVIVVGTLLYTRKLVEELLAREREIAGLHARSLEFIANRPADKGTDQSDYSFIFNEIIRYIDFPMILTDGGNEPIPDYRLNIRNVPLDTALAPDEQRVYLGRLIADFDRQNPPINVILKVTPQDSIVQHLHYGESELITRLRWLPYIEIGVAGIFILIGYVGFSSIKRSEQSNIWVGMAKETAHQLGTPLSSLMGWVEMMKEHAAESPRQLVTLADMEQDLHRLQKVTERFSKIGSKPMLKEENLHELIEGVGTYFRQRLPSRFGEGRHIDILVTGDRTLTARVNRELFEWVIENLIKNAIDAMERDRGTITFSITSRGRTIFIDVKDTGKGIDMKAKRDIFRPGYSTKTRGWGLGLSLSKRIVESYHRGKIFVKESRLGKGTTFRIRLHR